LLFPPNLRDGSTVTARELDSQHTQFHTSAVIEPLMSFVVEIGSRPSYCHVALCLIVATTWTTHEMNHAHDNSRVDKPFKRKNVRAAGGIWIVPENGKHGQVSLV
jgi:hypothetical protein